MIELDWIKRPIAHRGLHNRKAGVIENSASSMRAAIDGGYAIEVDLQTAACGTPMVFHDARLERLTDQTGPVAERTAFELNTIPLKDSRDRLISLNMLLAMVDGAVPLLLEIKHEEASNGRFESRIVSDLEQYKGNIALMSFEPTSLMALQNIAPDIPRGFITDGLSIGDIPYLIKAKPHFLAYNIDSLPAITPAISKFIARQPLLCWTVRTDLQRQRAQRWTDGMIFEGFYP